MIIATPLPGWLLESQAARNLSQVADIDAMGARVRTLRERAGVQAQALAAAIGIDPSAMSNIERGKRAVKADELVRIANALRISPLAILEPDSLPARMPVAPRSEGGTLQDGDAYPRLLALAELHEVLKADGILSQPSLDDVPIVDEAEWRHASEALVEWARKRLGTAAAGDDRFSSLVEQIEDELRIDVLVEAFPGDPLTGAAIGDRDFPLIFVNADYHTPRGLFTLAHELGHLLAGHDGGVSLDADLSGRNPSERLANAFAASFLMPQERIEEMIDRFRRGAESLARMTHEFGVSFESLVYRLHNLQIINAQGRDRLRSQGWQGLLRALDEPELSEVLEPAVRKSLRVRLGTRPEQHPPGWLTARALAGYRKGTISIRPVAGLLDVDADELLDRLRDLPDDVLQGNYQSHGEVLSDDELYEGSPF